MVPGSTFRYGSNFCSETVRPRLSSRHPIDAAEMPLPSEETTPPVTKMNLFGAPEVLGIFNSRFVDGRLTCAQQQLYPFEIRRRIHSHGFVIRFDNANGKCVFQSPE